MLTDVFKGIKAYFNSFYLISELKLWKYFFIPILISVTTTVIIGFAAYHFSDDMANFISKIWKWEFGKKGFEAVVEIVSATIIIVIGFVLYKHIVLTLSAPFMSPVSEKIEAHLLGKNITSTTSVPCQLWRAIQLSVINLIKELLLTVPILLFGLIPVIGLFSTVLLFLIQSYYAGFGNMDYTLERHCNYQQSVRFVKKNKGLAIGNGMIFMLFLLIPIFGVLLVLPFSVTAATIVTVQKLETKTIAS